MNRSPFGATANSRAPGTVAIASTVNPGGTVRPVWAPDPSGMAAARSKASVKINRHTMTQK